MSTMLPVAPQPREARPGDEAIDAARCAVVLVDYQVRLLPAIDGGSEVVRHACILADAARLLGVRVVGTEQNPAGLGSNVPEVAGRCDAVLTKRRFDACADGLAEVLDAHGPRNQVVIAGCEAHVCLLQTALGLLDDGLQVFVAEDACGSRAPRSKELALDRLRQAGAVIVNVEMAAFEWVRNAQHEQFRAVSALIK